MDEFNVIFSAVVIIIGVSSFMSYVPTFGDYHQFGGSYETGVDDADTIESQIATNPLAGIELLLVGTTGNIAVDLFLYALRISILYIGVKVGSNLVPFT